MQHQVSLHKALLTRYAKGHPPGIVFTPIIDIRVQKHENLAEIFLGSMFVADRLPHQYKLLLLQVLQVHTSAVH